jgi:hypothetical protein
MPEIQDNPEELPLAEAFAKPAVASSSPSRAEGDEWSRRVWPTRLARWSELAQYLFDKQWVRS